MANSKKPVRWTEKFHQVKKIADEPALNREGFWKEFKGPEVKSGKRKEAERD